MLTQSWFCVSPSAHGCFWPIESLYHFACSRSRQNVEASAFCREKREQIFCRPSRSCFPTVISFDEFDAWLGTDDFDKRCRTSWTQVLSCLPPCTFGNMFVVSDDFRMQAQTEHGRCAPLGRSRAGPLREAVEVGGTENPMLDIRMVDCLGHHSRICTFQV